MSEWARMMLVNGIAAAKDGDREAACRYLERALNSEPDTEQKVEAWLWLSEVSEDIEEKRKYLEYVIGTEPWEPRARRALAILNGKLDPDEVIDPDRLERAQASEPVDVRSHRYVCPQCGGRMTFLSESAGVSCAYCGHRLSLAEALQQIPVEEQEFVITLATAEGHTRPVSTRAFACQGCGASFVVGPGTLSLTCPYCASPYVLESPEKEELIEPQGIIPMALTEEQARKALAGWLKQRDLAPEALTSSLNGLYLPVWTFDVGGEVKWRGTPAGSSSQRSEWHWQKGGWGSRNAVPEEVPQASGGTPIFYDDVLVPASHALPAKLMAVTHHYDLSRLQPYSPDYLAGWPAAVYQVSLADASIVARSRAWERAKEEAQEQLSGDYWPGNLTLSSHAVSILSYKLILLPLWVTRYRYRGKQYGMVVDGQNGTVVGEAPPFTGLRRFFNSLLE